MWYNLAVTSELRSGGLIRLRLRGGSLLAWLLPAWATACGAIASGMPAATPEGAVRLLLALLLVEAGWGAVWEALATTDWAAPIRRWRNWYLGEVPLSLLPPYSRPGSPAERIARWLAQLRAWGQGVLSPMAGRALGTVAAGLLLSTALALALGQGPLLLTLGLLAMMQLALVLEKGKAPPRSGWDGVIRVGWPWLVGHVLFAPLTLSSLLVAAAFSIAAVGMSQTEKGQRRLLELTGQSAVALLLILLHRPLAVPFLALFLVPQWLLSAQADDGRRTRRAWIWLAAGMLLTACAL